MPLSSFIHQTVRTLISFGKRFGHTQQRWMRLYAFTSPGQETKYHGLTVYLCLTAAMTISPWVFPVATAAADVPVRRDITLSGAQLFEETLFSQGSTVVKTSGEYSKLFSFIVGADFLQQFYDDGAVLIRLRGSQKLAEGLIRAGVTFADNRGIFVVTARELHNKLEFQFNSATQEEWIREAQVGAEVAFKFENVKIGSYLSYAQTPSKELDNQLTIKDTTTLYEEYTLLKRIAGGTRAEAGLTADFQMTPDTTLRLGGGARKKMVDWSNGQITTTEGTYEAGIRTRLTKRDLLNLTGRGSNSLVGGEFRYTHVTNGGVQTSIGIAGEQQKESRSDVRLMAGLSIPFGVDGPALPAAKPVERNPMPKIVSSRVVSQNDSGARNNRFSTADIKQLVGTVPAYAAGYIIDAAVDTTTVQKLALSIDKTAINGAQVIAGGNISYSLAAGSTFGAFNAGASNVGADAFTLTNAGQTIVINPTILGNYLPATATATSPATLSIVFANSTVTVVAYKGSVHIKSVTVTSSADTTPPVTSAAPAISTPATATTVSVTQTINETGTGYYLILPATATAPTVAVVKTGTSFAMTAATPAIVNVTGLTASTAYKYYFVAKDAANNDQTTVSTGLAITTAADTTQPVTSAAPAIATLASATTVSVTQTINENGTGYYLMLPATAAAPTVAAVKAGTSFAMTAATPAIVNITGLTASTAYMYYFVAKDAANNDQATVSTGLAITTAVAVADTTPPATSAAPAISTLASVTTVSVTQTINKNGTGYYLLLPAAAAAPTVAEVKAGTSFAMTAATPAIVNITGLTASTAYMYYFVAKDTANNDQTAVSTGLAITTVADTTPPVTSAAPAISTPATDTTVSVTQTINETGTGYYLILPAASGAPTVAAVKAGTSFAMTAGSPTSVSITDLTAGTAYKYYFVATDAAGNDQTSVPTGLAITTTDTSPPATTAVVTPTDVSASIAITSNEVGELHIIIQPATLAAPNLAAIKTGSLVTMIAGVNTVSVPGLTPSTAYTIYYVAKDAAGNWQTAETVKSFTTNATIDTTPPTTSAHSVGSITATTAVLSTTIDEAGTGYYVVQPAAMAAPSVAQIMAGQDSAGATALNAGSGAMVANTAKTFNISGLTTLTAYKVYFVAKDVATTPNPQTTMVSDSFSAT